MGKRNKRSRAEILAKREAERQWADASPVFQLLAQGVPLARYPEDVQATIRLADELHTHLTSRGWEFEELMSDGWGAGVSWRWPAASASEDELYGSEDEDAPLREPDTALDLPMPVEADAVLPPDYMRLSLAGSGIQGEDEQFIKVSELDAQLDAIEAHRYVRGREAPLIGTRG